MNASLAAGNVHTAFIGIGSNLDDPVGRVRAALAALERMDATRVCKSSSLYRSTPVGYSEQPDFINAVAQVETGLDAQTMLSQLLALEQAQGRVRSVRNGPRTLDLDLLLYDRQCIEQADLVVPHPRMHQRAFVLVPLAEIASDACIPGHGRVAQLLQHVGTLGVQRLDDPAPCLR